MVRPCGLSALWIIEKPGERIMLLGAFQFCRGARYLAFYHTSKLFLHVMMIDDTWMPEKSESGLKYIRFDSDAIPAVSFRIWDLTKSLWSKSCPCDVKSIFSSLAIASHTCQVYWNEFQRFWFCRKALFNWKAASTMLHIYISMTWQYKHPCQRLIDCSKNRTRIWIRFIYNSKVARMSILSDGVGLAAFILFPSPEEEQQGQLSST